MDINLILQAISTVGFPICACGALFWLVNRLETDHKAEVNNLREIIERNTEALIELKDSLRRD